MEKASPTMLSQHHFNEFFRGEICLESGARILGVLGLIGSTVGVFASTFLLGAAVFNFPAIEKALNNFSEAQVENETSQFVVIIVTTLLLAYCVFGFYACIQLIRSVKNRSSRQLRPYMILIAFETIVACLPILKLTWQGLVQAAGGVIINGYFFVCIHSLWEIFRDEAMRGYNRQYQQGSVCNKV